MVPWSKKFNTFYLVTYSSFTENRLSLTQLKDRLLSSSRWFHKDPLRNSNNIFSIEEVRTSCLICW